jgi:hypothetical protein
LLSLSNIVFDVECSIISPGVKSSKYLPIWKLLIILNFLFCEYKYFIAGDFKKLAKRVEKHLNQTRININRLKSMLISLLCMEHGAWSLGHGAWGMGHGVICARK